MGSFEGGFSLCLCRFAHLVNVFSKSLDRLKAAVALYMAWYNFCRVHQTLRVTPAMEAGITGHIWSLVVRSYEDRPRDVTGQCDPGGGIALIFGEKLK